MLSIEWDFGFIFFIFRMWKRYTYIHSSSTSLGCSKRTQWFTIKMIKAKPPTNHFFFASSPFWFIALICIYVENELREWDYFKQFLNCFGVFAPSFYFKFQQPIRLRLWLSSLDFFSVLQTHIGSGENEKKHKRTRKTNKNERFLYCSHFVNGAAPWLDLFCVRSLYRFWLLRDNPSLCEAMVCKSMCDISSKSLVIFYRQHFTNEYFRLLLPFWVNSFLFRFHIACNLSLLIRSHFKPFTFNIHHFTISIYIIAMACHAKSFPPSAIPNLLEPHAFATNMCRAFPMEK